MLTNIFGFEVVRFQRCQGISNANGGTKHIDSQKFWDSHIQKKCQSPGKILWKGIMAFSH